MPTLTLHQRAPTSATAARRSAYAEITEAYEAAIAAYGHELAAEDLTRLRRQLRLACRLARRPVLRLAEEA